MLYEVITGPDDVPNHQAEPAQGGGDRDPDQQPQTQDQRQQHSPRMKEILAYFLMDLSYNFV